jgi:carboxyl-terminal processing protease
VAWRRISILAVSGLAMVTAFAARPVSSSAVSLETRVLTASKIYHLVSTFFPSLDQARFDAAYSGYLRQILTIEDRREFDLASMELLATLHDGHTWFDDKWLDDNYGQPIGFFAFPAGEHWTVRRTQLESIRVGDVITAVDGLSMPEFLASKRRYISASSDRDAQLSLFLTPQIFPLRFSVTLTDGRRVKVDRVGDRRREEPPLKTEGRWIRPGLAYIKVPVFRGIKFAADGVENLRQFHEARALILDVRGNEGLGSGLPLQAALMEKPYPAWNEHSVLHGGTLLRHNGAHPTLAELSTSDAVVNPDALEPPETHFKGPLILLIDRECTCACEDFVMPFKVTHRAELIGETTAGTSSATRFSTFENGMILNVAAVRHVFPDGSRFEGVGITPDIKVEITPEDLRAGRDPVLDKAVERAAAKSKG